MRPKTTGAYRREYRQVYAETDGVGLVMDIFHPVGPSNGLGIIDVVCGAWRSDRVRFNEHLGLGAIDAFCERGYTVFAVMPGSATKFTGMEMVSHVQAAMRHILAHHAHLGINPKRLGAIGVSAGGHLAALAFLCEERFPALRALGLFFPPTDLLDFGGTPFDFAQTLGLPLPRLLFEDELAQHSKAEIRDAALHLSPARRVLPNPPPVFLLHGDADPVVPLEQSEKLVKALREAGGEAEFHVKPGGKHPWPTIREEIQELLEWFGRQLGAKGA